MPCFFFSGIAKGKSWPSKSLLCPATKIERSKYSNRTVINSNKAVSSPSSLWSILATMEHNWGITGSIAQKHNRQFEKHKRLRLSYCSGCTFYLSWPHNSLLQVFILQINLLLLLKKSLIIVVGIDKENYGFRYFALLTTILIKLGFCQK